ncbi:MAG: hypothetical protein LBQ02_02095 [Candidatus Nomurabacteria bacterium]|jgi:hypothetical protein|nr:hypothetical protein [Candidatus Nomurabacteria bacterium]
MINNRRVLLIFMLIVAVAFVGWIIYTYTRNPYGDYIEINNLGKLTAGKPQNKDSVNFIQHDLLVAIQRNSSATIKNKSIKDVFVRDSSFSQTYDDVYDVHSVEFIVDIESIKQSYKVSYQWSEIENNDHLSEYGTMVLCLPASQLIYGDFDCKDQLILEKGDSKLDPIIEILPHKTDVYNLQYGYDNSGSLRLKASIYIDIPLISEYESQINEKISSIKSQIAGWLSSQGFDINKYVVDYSVFY